MLVDGAEMYVVTLGLSSFTAEEYAAALEGIRDAARALDGRDVDSIVSGGTPAYTHEGTDSEDRLIDELNDELDAEFTTSLSAHVDALRALDAERLLVLTPYPERADQERREYFQDRGFEVASIGGIYADAPGEIKGLPTGATYRMAREAASEADEFDAVYISNPQWEVARFIEDLEDDLGKPIVGTAQAQVWKGYEMADLSPDLDGFGQLFETL